MYKMYLCDKVCQWPATGRWFSPGTPVSSTNKTDRHDFNWNIVGSAFKHHPVKARQNSAVYTLGTSSPCKLIYINVSIYRQWSIINTVYL
jgi:hypothetical protein